MTAPQLPAGHVVAGKYSIKMQLASAGASVTYRAVTAQGREVALKLFDMALRQHAEAMGALERIYAGTNAMPADLVGPIIDAGYDPTTGAPFSVTDFMPVPSLAALVQSGPMPPDAAFAMLSSMGRALDIAQSMQLSHSAVSPTNVFVGPAPGYPVKLTDFGADVVRRAVPTPEGQMVAAPWQAPEQAQGQAGGAPADVFAAGLIAFFALTGRPYWRSCQGQSVDLNGWHRELMGARVAPSQRAAELGAALSPAFDGLISQALAIDPNERFRSVGELAAAFGRALASGESGAAMQGPPPQMGAPPMGPPMGAPPQMGPAYAMGPQTSPPPPQQKSSKLVPILIGVAALLLVGVAGAVWFVMQEVPPPVALAIEVPAPPPEAEAPPPEPEPAPSAEAPPTDAEVKLTCTPECDLTVDGAPFAGGRLSGGEHKVVATKAGFVQQSESITVEPGVAFEREYALVAVPKAPTGAGTPPPLPTAKCGKFLKRCKD